MIELTFEQLVIFVAVGELEHLTRAAEQLRLTPSAVSASIKALEAFYRVQLFHRVGRRIELTESGRIFLQEAKAVLSRVTSAELILSELGQLKRGLLRIHASQTIATYWLPPRLMRFREQYPGIEIDLMLGNTRAVAAAVITGSADIGFIEGTIDEPVLSSRAIAEDQLIVLTAPGHPFADGHRVTAAELVSGASWVIREVGSGTRSEFEAALIAAGADPELRKVFLVLPSNEAVMSAVRNSSAACAVSRLAARPFLDQGELKEVNFQMPRRALQIVRHKERHFSEACKALERICSGTGVMQI